VLTELNLRDVSLVGFSMGGGEVARYITRHGQEWLHSVVFAAAVPPYLAHTPDNPDGPLSADAAAQMIKGLTNERDGFFDQFTTQFFSAGGQLKVTELVVLDGAPHGCNVSHAGEFNQALINFLRR
jgi:pimeloyl-ACP methyl ester carboxylesterase